MPFAELGETGAEWALDRKSTCLNSSHRCISYAVFCLKKKKKHNKATTSQTVARTRSKKKTGTKINGVVCSRDLHLVSHTIVFVMINQAVDITCTIVDC